jgi:hypothetical protein
VGWSDPAPAYPLDRRRLPPRGFGRLRFGQAGRRFPLQSDWRLLHRGLPRRGPDQVRNRHPLVPRVLQALRHTPPRHARMSVLQACPQEGGLGQQDRLLPVLLPRPKRTLCRRLALRKLSSRTAPALLNAMMAHAAKAERMSQGWVAVCSTCNWLGGDHRTPGPAAAEARQHRHGKRQPWTLHEVVPWSPRRS